jgi:hypothetical protein
MVSLASDLFAVHAQSLLRKRDVKTCRGDLSEKLQVRSASSHKRQLRSNQNFSADQFTLSTSRTYVWFGVLALKRDQRPGRLQRASK